MTTETIAADSYSQGRAFYRTQVFRRQMILLALVVALLFSLCVDLALGPARYSLGEVVAALLTPQSVSQQARVILWEIRMPVALMALVVGASLSVAGAQMQTILSNPLASPFTLGISAGASFGAALGLAFGVAIVPTAIEFVVPLNAFIMAMFTAFLIHALSLKRGVTVETIVLLGIAMVFIFNSLMALIQFFCKPGSRLGSGVLDHGQLNQSDMAQILDCAGHSCRCYAAACPSRLGAYRHAPGRCQGRKHGR
ncbi:MAG: FecCD family ABC transporter permease [Halomonas sp.]